ncbi:MAG: hypothetical protein NTZ69_05895 [Bacteroidia bacterium]|nr:hypothetical protein [Bacteroidia bacterium]
MKITLTDEQVNSLIEVEISKRVKEYSSKFNKELLKVQSQLSDALTLVNELLSNQVVNTKKDKLTPEVFTELWNAGKNTSQIAKETGYNASYVSTMKRKLIEKGIIKEQIK